MPIRMMVSLSLMILMGSAVSGQQTVESIPDAILPELKTIDGTGEPATTNKSHVVSDGTVEGAADFNSIDPADLKQVPPAPIENSIRLAKRPTGTEPAQETKMPRSVLLRPESSWQSISDRSERHANLGHVQCTCCDTSCEYSPNGIISRAGMAPVSSGYPVGGSVFHASVGDREDFQDIQDHSTVTASFNDAGNTRHEWENRPTNQPGLLVGSGMTEPSDGVRLVTRSAEPAGVVSSYPANSAVGALDSCGTCQSDRYFSTFGGYVMNESFQDSFIGGNQQPVDVEGSFRDGWLVGFASGQFVRPSVRAEMEFSFRTNSGDTWTATSGGGMGSAPLDGRMNIYSGMTNLLIDKNVGSVRPYFGAGFGFAFVDADLRVGATNLLIDESAFAYQAILGVAMRRDPRGEFFTEYRFFGTDDVDLVNTSSGRVTPHRANSHNIVFGVRLFR